MTILDLIAILTLVATGGTSIYGWIYAVRRNGRENGRLEMTIKQHNDTLTKLPCQANPKYGEQWGRLLEKIDSYEKRLERIENAVEEIRQNGKR